MIDRKLCHFKLVTSLQLCSTRGNRTGRRHCII